MNVAAYDTMVYEPMRWLPMSNSLLTPKAGSALDLSGFSQYRDINSQTFLITEGDKFVSDDVSKKSVRFFSATIMFTPGDGGFPDHAQADQIAVMLKRNAYNAVRLHGIEEMLMNKNRTKDFDYDPEQLDRLLYLVSAIKKQGMYLFIDSLSLWNGAYGDVGNDRFIRGMHDIRIGSYFPGKDSSHWYNLVRTLWAAKNPYTGMSTLEDPALAGVVLVNEGDTDFLLRYYNPSFLDPFKKWIIAKYGDSNTIKSNFGVTPENLYVPNINDVGRLASEFQTFTTQLQVIQIDWMRNSLRSFGYKGAVTELNSVPSYHNSASRQYLDFVDMHQYVNLPLGGTIEPGTKIVNSRLLDGKSRYFDILSWSRHFNLPYTVTEYGQSFWNPYRWEVGPFTAAYARLHDWSLISLFGNSASLSRPDIGVWRNKIIPFQVSIDPTLRSGETIAAFLYGRGDVSPSGSTIELKLDSKVAESSPAFSFISWQLAQLQYMVKVGLDMTNTPSDVNNPAAPPSNKSYSISANNEPSIWGVYDQLLLNNFISSNSFTSLSEQRYQSSTAELNIDLKYHNMKVNTKGSVGMLGSPGTNMQTKNLKLNIISGDGAIFLSDLGSGDLNSSNRMLMVVSTDSRNSNMKFTDATETQLVDIGTLPFLIRDIRVAIEWINPKNETWRLYALSPTGERTQQIPLNKLSNSNLRVDMHLSDLGSNVTPYFEWVKCTSSTVCQ
jgi:hypothetical protein